MNKAIHVALLIVLPLTAIAAFAAFAEENPIPLRNALLPTEGPLDALGKKVFRALQKKDPAPILALRVTPADLIATIERLERVHEGDERVTEELAEGREEIEREFSGERLAKLHGEQADCVKKVVAKADWSKAKLVGIEYEVGLEDFGIRSAEIDLHIELGETKYRVDFNELIETPNGWLMIEDDPIRVREDD